MTQLSRRSLIGSLISLVAAPAIVRAGSLMPVKVERNIIDPTEEMLALLRKRIADAEHVMMENIKTCLFGDGAFGISGQSNNVYYEPLYQLKMQGVEIVFDPMVRKDTVYLLPEVKS